MTRYSILPFTFISIVTAAYAQQHEMPAMGDDEIIKSAMSAAPPRHRKRRNDHFHRR
jgi:hypothetical protein